MEKLDLKDGPDNNIGRYLEAFGDFENSLNGGSDPRIHERRKAAMKRFAEKGFPTLKDEAWRYTSVRSLANTEMTAAVNLATNFVEFSSQDFPDLGGAQLVFIDGEFSESQSRLTGLPDGVIVESLPEALKAKRPQVIERLGSLQTEKESSFVSLNLAFVRDGAYVEIPDGIVVDKPVTLLFFASGGEISTHAHPRILVNAGKSSAVSIVEVFAAADDRTYFTNVVTEIFADANTRIDHYRLQLEGPHAWHIGTSLAALERDSVYRNHYFSFGGKLSRNDIHAVLKAEGAECVLNGLFMPTGSQHMDSNTLIDHVSPRCSSHELYKGILDDSAHGVFTGRIIVQPGAQKTDARQSNKNLLLSEKAAMDTRPQLEIYADDVKCSHGTTIGRIDQQALFYLRSRGIDEKQAYGVLSYAFAGDIIGRVTEEPLREYLDAVVHRMLNENADT